MTDKLDTTELSSRLAAWRELADEAEMEEQTSNEALLIAALREACQDIERMREALAFYAEPSHWRREYDTPLAVEFDRGERARKAISAQ